MNGLISAHDVEKGNKLFDINTVAKVDRSKTALTVPLLSLTYPSLGVLFLVLLSVVLNLGPIGGSRTLFGSYRRFRFQRHEIRSFNVAY